MAPIVRISKLDKYFGHLHVLKEISLEVMPREVICVIGRSGSGKTVLLKCILGLHEPDSGQILYDGRNFTQMKIRERKLLRRELGMVFQGGALFDSLTVFGNVAFPLRETTSLGEAEIRDRVRERLAQVGLEGQGGKYPDELSGGMVRRVALARAMVTDPQIILFDEPTTGLDPIIRNSILNLICHTWHKNGFTMVMISHDIPEIFQWCHFVAVVHDGLPDPERGVTRFALEIPRGLSLLAFHDPDAEVKGLRAFPRETWPNVRNVHLAFQVMVGLGSLLAAVSAAALVLRLRRREPPAWLLRAVVLASPAGFVALEAGWLVTEWGRQPFTVHGVLTTAASVTPVAGLTLPLVAFLVLYVFLGAVTAALLWRQIAKAPAAEVRP